MAQRLGRAIALSATAQDGMAGPIEAIGSGLDLRANPEQKGMADGTGRKGHRAVGYAEIRRIGRASGRAALVF